MSSVPVLRIKRFNGGEFNEWSKIVRRFFNETAVGTPSLEDKIMGSQTEFSLTQPCKPVGLMGRAFPPG